MTSRLPFVVLRRGAVLAALSAAGLMAAVPSPAQNGGPTGAARVPLISQDSAAPRTVAVVHQGLYNYVRIERAEDGAAPNLHPLDISEEDLSRLLGALRLGPRALLNKDDLDDIVPPLAAALGRATAQQDVSFAVAGRHSAFGLMAARDVTTARVFNTAAGLQVIVGLAHKPFEDRVKVGLPPIPFEPGRRAAPLAEPVELKLAASAGSLPRADWVVLRTSGLAQAQVQTPVQVQAQVQVQTPAPAAASPVQPPASAVVDARFRDISERLKTLERLRDAGLITPQEYEQKRKKIVEEL